MSDKEPEIVPPIGSEEAAETALEVVDDDVIMPDLFDLPKEWSYTKRAVVALTCYNMKPKYIAKQLGLNVWAVREHLKDSKVKEIAKSGSDVRKMVLAAGCEAVALKCLSRIKSSEIDALPLDKRIGVAAKCVKTARGLDVKPFEEKMNENELVKKLKAGVKKENVATEAPEEPDDNQEA